MGDRIADAPERMAAFDALPPTIRHALDWAPFRLDVAQIIKSMGFLGIAKTRKMIESSGPSNVRAASREWESLFGRPSPHVAARATIMETHPVDEAVVVKPRKRRPRWMLG